MSRRRLRYAVLAVVLVGVTTLVVQLRGALEAQKGKEIDSTALEGMLPDAVQWIQDFHRIEIKDGKTAWEVRGDEAQYLEEKEQVLVRGPKAALFTAEGERVEVTGGEAVVGFDGQSLKDVQVQQDVIVKFRDFVIRAPNATYRHEEQKIVSTGAVDIKGDRVELQGQDLVVFMTDSRFELRDPVRVLLLPETATASRTATSRNS